MRTRGYLQKRRAPFDVAMTPMIDVVFLLLVFFVWTTSFQMVEKLLPGGGVAVSGQQVAAETPPKEMDYEPIVVRITNVGGQVAWSLNGVDIADVVQLGVRLSSFAAIKHDVPVIVDPAPDVPLGPVIEMYDMAREVGCTQVHFAAESP